MPALLREWLFAACLLRKSRGFTVIASVSLTLAIGANTTFFSIAKQLLFEMDALRRDEGCATHAGEIFAFTRKTFVGS